MSDGDHGRSRDGGDSNHGLRANDRDDGRRSDGDDSGRINRGGAEDHRDSRVREFDSLRLWSGVDKLHLLLRGALLHVFLGFLDSDF